MCPAAQVITLKSAVTIDPDAGEITGRFHRLARRRPRAASTSCSTTPTPIRPSRSAPASIPSCPTTPAASRRSRSTRRRARSSTASIRRRSMPAMSSACMCRCRSSRRSITSCRTACWPKAPARCGRCRSRASATTGEPFTSSMFNYSGGMGARATKTGPSATCYPTGVAAVPVEIVEAVMPIVFDRKELRPGSGGDGAMRGGDGQIIQFRLQTKDEWLLNAVREPRRGGPRGPRRRRAGRGRKIPCQRQAGARRSRSSPCSRMTSYCSRRREAAATDIAELKPDNKLNGREVMTKKSARGAGRSRGRRCRPRRPARRRSTRSAFRPA